MSTLKQHIPLYIIIATSLVVCAGVLISYSFATDQRIQLVQLQIANEHKILDEKIHQAHKAAAEKERARKATALAIADRAARGDISTDGIDSRHCATTHTHTNPHEINVVVNKKHCIQPLSFVPTDLVTLFGATLRKQASDAFIKMATAAGEVGLPIFVTSSYRSYADQVATYTHWVATSGQEVADTYSARPGYSEHQTGLVVDIAAPGCVLDCFGSTAQYAWLREHAATYGFIQRYHQESEHITGYKAEEWHFRYVGSQTALRMKSEGIMTIEQLFNVPGGSY